MSKITYSIINQTPHTIILHDLDKYSPAHYCIEDICKGCLIDWNYEKHSNTLKLSYDITIETGNSGLSIRISNIEVTGYVRIDFEDAHDKDNYESLFISCNEYEVILESNHSFTPGVYIKPILNVFEKHINIKFV